MIKFQKITIKNFLSYGNNPTTFLLDKSPTTLITGKNGHGKSVLADAISFALFNKSFRGINLPKLVNATNKKDLVVQIEFSSGTDAYKIVRTLAPSSVTIIKNGVPMDELAALRDSQDYIEKNILKFNHNSFCQTCIIGSSNHIPFLELNASQRRKLVEELFGINAFSTMNTLLKSKVNAWKDSINEKNFEIERCNNSIEHLKDFINTLSTQADSSKRDYSDQIKAKEKELDALKERAQQNLNQIEKYENGKQIIEVSLLDPYNKEILEKEIDDIEDEIRTSKSKLSTLEKHITRLKQGEGKECPSCFQEISHEHVESCVKEISEEQIRNENSIENFQGKLSPLKSRIQEHTSALEEIKQHNDNIKACKQVLANIKENINRIKGEIKDLSERQEAVDTSSLEETKSKLSEAEGQHKLLTEQKQALLDKGQTYTVALDLLKDTGIKSLIIKQYLPILNARVNHYLQAMNFNAKFEMDEQFNDTVRIRNQTFEYKNFSMGEKQRLSLGLLFAWRDLASIKGSVAANILFLDETLDASLDEQGTTDLLAIIDDISRKTNIFVVSHKNALEDKFRSILRINKINGFSVIQ
jgi:DNA repair exonuclease SbcCD ATPase subunit